jgi:hypothetical protein
MSERTSVLFLAAQDGQEMALLMFGVLYPCPLRIALEREISRYNTFLPIQTSWTKSLAQLSVNCIK